jgi:MFS family permease
LPDRSGIWQVGGVRIPAPEEPSTWLDKALGLVSAALPFGLAVTRAASAGQWRDDLPAVRDLGLVAVGVSGSLSTFVSQALSLLPLGSRTFRAALGSSIALAVAASLLFWIGRRLLTRAGAPPRLGSVLAAIATLTAALSPSWQREGTVGGGAMLATAAVLGVLAAGIASVEASSAQNLKNQKSSPSARAFLGIGALLGATFAESPPAGLAALAGLALLFVPLAPLVLLVPFASRAARPDARALPPRRVLLLGALAALVTFALFLAPLALRPAAPRAFSDIGRALSASSVAAFDIASARTTALAAWTREISVVSLGIAAAGAVIALLRSRTRELLLPFIAILLLDTLLPARVAGALSADPLTSYRVLALASIALCSALGVAAIARALLHARIPMAKSGAVLLVVFHVTLVALTSEEAGFAADRSQQLAAEVWVDQALGRLEPRAAILVRSPAVAWRLWAARITRGERPDVIVIPVPLLNRGRVAAGLLAEERALEPLLRDFAMTGDFSEFALSSLADARPLHVELDRRWGKRIISHLAIDGLWLEFAVQPLGPSDRRLGASAQAAPLKRVLAAANAGGIPDAPTSSVVAEALINQSSVLMTLGEHDAAQALYDRADALLPRDSVLSGAVVRQALGGIRRALAAREAPRAR